MEIMYPGKVNSPATVLDGNIDDVITTINVIDGSVLPDAPNIAVIGTGEDAETILYETKVENALSNVTRGFQGVAKAWDSGTPIARLFTEYDYAKLKQNIENLKFLGVTAKTEACTLTAAETGIILVTAASAYTISLPSASDNIGLTYTIKKTDANTNLITIDGNEAETIDGAETYTDLNYQYAYVSIVSDGTNWHIIEQSTVRGGTF